jgi:Serine incorporator (Serinc)
MWITKVSPNIAKYVYFGGYVLVAIVTWLLKDYAFKGLSHTGGLGSCSDAAEPHSCVGNGAVLRISFGNFMFFALQCLILIGGFS